MKCPTAWGIELAELDGVTRRSDQESLKAFLTERIDTFRAPYARTCEQHERRFVFWGTSNAPPLRDPTGSTRFVTIPIDDCRPQLDWVKANRDAIWARAVEEFFSGVEWDRCDEAECALIAERNEDFTEIDPWADQAEEFLNIRQQSMVDLPVKIPAILNALEVPRE